MAQIRRTQTIKNKKHVGVVYPALLPTHNRDTRPAAVASWFQGNWGIENRLHWVKNAVLDENHHQLRTANGPQITATRRNPAISLIRLIQDAVTSIACATRSLSRQSTRSIRILIPPTT